MKSKRENELSEELKSLCIKQGEKWKESNSRKSAHTLHKLGLLYKNKCLDESRYSLERKITFIQSAALLNGAFVRDPLEEIKKDLHSLCSELLKAAGADQQEFDLINYSSSLKHEIEEWRTSLKNDLDKITYIPDDISEENKTQLEQKKVENVEKLQTRVTDKYKSLMKKVSETCITLLGKIPCQYSLVGMGSMARKEITPYSDFENLILLQRGVQLRGKEEYEKIKEYFRWFAVIFQVILINLGETILPSVAIPSLNDFIKPNADWFFDAVTKRGISFDGMMPHACKSPLGRQQILENKPWKTELIKPVEEMVQYLEHEEDLKSGYHLADILTSTCYVAGSKRLYKLFEIAVKKKLTNAQHKTKQEVINVIKKDMKTYSTKLSISTTIENDSYNIKQFVYRSTTIFITGLAKMHNKNYGSCFEIVRKMRHHNLISQEFACKLLYAIAVACEIRLKTYLSLDGQEDYIDSSFEDKRKFASSFTEDDEDITSNLIKAVGKQSCYDYFEIACCLQYDVIAHLKLGGNYMYFHPVTLCTVISSFLNLHDRIVAAKHYADVYPILCDQPIDEESSNRSNGIAGTNNKDDGDSSNGDTDTNGEEDGANSNRDVGTKDKEDGVSFNGEDVDHDGDNGDVGTVIGSWYSQMQKFNHELISFNNQRQECALGSKTIVPDRDDVTDVLFEFGKYFFEKEVYFEACHCFKTTLKWLHQDYQDTKRVNTAQCLYWFGKSLHGGKKYRKAIALLKDSLDIYQGLTDDRKDEENFEGDCLKELATCQKELDQLEESCDSFVQALNAYKPFTDSKFKSVHFCLKNLGICLNNLRRYEDAKTKFEELLEFYSDNIVTSCVETKRLRAHCEWLLGDCMQNLGLADARDHLQKAVEIFRDLAMDEQIDDNVRAFCLHDSGRCLISLNEFERAVRSFLKAIEFKENLYHEYDDEEHSFHMGGLYIHIAKCYQNLDLHHKAIEQLNKFQPFFEILSKRLFSKPKLLELCSNFGNSYYELDDFNHAYDLYRKALIEVSEETPQQIIARLNRRCGLCLKQFDNSGGDNDNTKASNYIKTSLKIYLKLPQTESENPMVLKQIGFCYFHLNNTSEATVFFEKYIEICKLRGRFLSHVDNVGLANVLKTIGFCKSKEKKWDEEFYYFKLSLEQYESLPNKLKKPTEIALLYRCIGKHLMYSKKLEEANECFEKSVKLCKSSSQTPKIRYQLGLTLKNVGDLMQKQKLYYQALMSYEEAKSIFLDLPKSQKHNFDLANLLKSIGNCQKCLAIHDKAIDSFEESLARLDLLHKDKECEVKKAFTLRQIGHCYRNLKCHHLSAQYFSKSNSVLETLPSCETNMAEIAVNRKLIANSFDARRLYPEALSHYKKALNLYKILSFSKSYEKEITFINRKLRSVSYEYSSCRSKRR